MTSDRIHARPQVPWDRTVIYEAHVRGMTMLSPSVPEALRGTYAGLAHRSVTDHLSALGVTTVELLPVFAHTTEPEVAARGLSNYWGYNTVDFFAPHAAYAAGHDPHTEFAAMVDALHAAGLEIVLDVVYNHTAVGAVDPSWYRREGGQIIDFSGCGNTVDVSRADVQEFILDSLRFWAGLGVDGFRFDLASALARNADHAVETPGTLFGRIAADPDLGILKLVVEPWDATADGYAAGAFRFPYAEWNDRFRDDVRDFWRGSGQGVADMATRLCGSSDLFDTPIRSVNFVTSHDGFTLRDLVSYSSKHNQANGEHGHDGHDDNRSDNCGVEGATRDRQVIARRQQRAALLLATLLLSRGVPMIRMGDEFGHSQGGNNNAYCQDNRVSWMPWRAEAGWDLRRLVTDLVAVRPGFTGPAFPVDDEVTWFGKAGTALEPHDWREPGVTGLGMALTDNALWMDSGEPSLWIRQSDLLRQVTPLGLKP